jgi:UDP-N-acetylenolpyruvoylglucosamine reductase
MHMHAVLKLHPPSDNQIHHRMASMNDKAKKRPDHHANKRGTAFRNPWLSQPKGLLASGQVFSQFPLAFAKRLAGHDLEPVQAVKPTFATQAPEVDAIKATWLGHAVRTCCG